LVERLADEQQFVGKDGTAQVKPGAADKRCLLRLCELSRCFKLGRRENATLSEHLREMWDGDPVSVPNRNGNALSTSGYAVSMVGDITPGVLTRLMAGGTEAFDGWANRFLWAKVKSPRCLPSGGDVGVLKRYLDRLQKALAFAKSAGEMRRDAGAEALWCEVYPWLKASGDSVPHTDRARAYALRLSMLYALADCSTLIRREHLRAALAVWTYCRQSASLLFASAPPQPESLPVRLLNAIRERPGLSRTDLREAAGHKVAAQEIEEALAGFVAQRQAHPRTDLPDGPGRPAERWYPGQEPEAPGEGINPEASDKVRQTEELIPSPAEGGGNCPGKDQSGNYFPPSPSVAGKEAPAGGQEGEVIPSPAGRGANRDCATPQAELIPSLPATGEAAPKGEERKEVVIRPQEAEAEAWSAAELEFLAWLKE
jgi:hypothetical protein